MTELNPGAAWRHNILVRIAEILEPHFKIGEVDPREVDLRLTELLERLAAAKNAPAPTPEPTPETEPVQEAPQPLQAPEVEEVLLAKHSVQLDVERIQRLGQDFLWLNGLVHGLLACETLEQHERCMWDLREAHATITKNHLI